MFLKMLRYDLHQLSKPMSACYAAALAFAASARLSLFSLTDMPLVYLLFFGSTGILVYRYRRTMFGAEATMLFSTTLSAHAHILARVLSFFLFSCSTTAITAVALIIQGETMGVMLLSLPAIHAALLYFEVVFALFFLTIQVTTILTLANIPKYRSKGALSILFFACVTFGSIALLSTLTKPILQGYLVLSATDGLFTSKSYVHASSVALSLNSSLWTILFAPINVISMIIVTRKKLMIA